jgi:hypothetical protein
MVIGVEHKMQLHLDKLILVLAAEVSVAGVELVLLQVAADQEL